MRTQATLNVMDYSLFGTAIDGLSAKQVALALSTQNLSQAQLEEIVIKNDLLAKYGAEELIKTGLLSANSSLLASEKAVSAEKLQEAIIENALNKEKAEGFVQTHLETIADGEEVASTAILNKALMDEMVKRGILSEEKANEILQSFGVVSGDVAETASKSALTKATWELVKAQAAQIATSPVGMIALAIGAGLGLMAIYDGLTTSLSEAQENLEDSMTAFNETTDEINSLNEELKTTEERIKELQKLSDSGTISVADEAELETLKEQNKELARQIALKQRQQITEGKEALEDAKEVSTKTVKSEYEFVVQSHKEGTTTGADVSVEKELQLAMDAYDEYKKLLKDDNLSEEQRSVYEDLLNDAESRVDEMYNILSTERQAYLDLDEAGYSLDNESKERLKDLNEIDDTYLLWNHTLTQTKQSFESLNAEQQRSILLNRLLKQGLSETDAQSVLGSISDTDLSEYWDKDFSFEPPILTDYATAEEYGKAYAEAWLNGVISETQNPNRITVLGVSETVDELNTKLKPAMAELKSAYQDIFTEDGFTLDNVSSSMLASIQDSILELNNMEGLDVDIPISDFEEFATILTDVNTTESQAEEAFDKFATSIVNGVGATQNLSDETAGLVTQLLEEMGVVNANEIVTEALALQKAKASQETKILADTTYAEAVALVNEAGATEITGQALAQLALEKLHVNGQTINTSADIDNVIALANAAGASAEALATLAEAKAILAGGDAYGRTQQDWAQDVINKINNGTFEYGFQLNADDFKVDFNGLGKKEAGKAGKDAGEEYKKQLEKELSDLGDVLSGITDIIDDQIGSLNDQKDAAVDALEAQKKAAEEALEAEKALLEEQKEGLQDKIDAKQDEIDAIKEAREQRQREFDLQKAQLEFERMQNQKTAFVYSEGKGFGYKENTEGIREARESVKEAQENITIASIEKEISNLETEIDKLDDLIESIDEQIEASNLYYDSLIENTEKYYDNLIKGLEDYKSRWEELGELEDQAKFEAKLKELGITTEDVLNMSESAFNTFKESYSNLLAELYQDNDGMISALSELTGIDFTPLSNSMGSFEEEVGNVSTSATEASTAVSAVGTSASTATSNITPLNEQLEKLQKLITEISNAFMSLQFPTIGEEGYAEKLNAVATAFGNIATKCDTFSKINFSSIIGSISGEQSKESPLASGGTGFMGLAKSIQDAVTVIQLQMNNLDMALEVGDTAFDEQIAKIRDEYIPQWEELQSRLAEIIGLGGGDNANTPSANANGEEGAGSIIYTLQTGGEEVDKKLEDPWLKAFEDFAEGDNSVKTICEKIVKFVTSMATSIQEQCTLAATALNGLANNALAVSLDGSSGGNTAVVKAEANGTVGKAFANGTGNYKGLPHAEKNALRSEYGQPELTVYPNGDVELTTQPTMSDLPKGTEIFNEEQTKRIMNNEGIPLGNAFANGTGFSAYRDDIVIETPTNLPSYLRPLQPGDKGYELTQKFIEHFSDMQNFIPPVKHMMEQMTESVQSMSKVVNTNTAYQQTVHNTYNVSLPNVTNESSAIQLMNELKQMSRDTYQYTHRK